MIMGKITKSLITKWIYKRDSLNYQKWGEINKFAKPQILSEYIPPII